MPTPAVGGERLPVVVARSVSKTFTVPEEQVHTLKERALHPRRRIRRNSYKALDNVSFAVQPGEFFGIAGRNGSGKSTLLKCMAGIYQADGDIWVPRPPVDVHRARRRLQPGPGGARQRRHERDHARSHPAEARKRYDSVIEFAELQEFKDLKLKNYSSGMHVRLAFSVAIQVDADILMIDEVLAVGDAAFQQKCFDVFNDLRDRGQDDHLRHPRHGRAAAVLSPGAAAGARQPGATSASPTRSPTAIWSSTSAAMPTPPRPPSTGAPATARRG